MCPCLRVYNNKGLFIAAGPQECSGPYWDPDLSFDLSTMHSGDKWSQLLSSDESRAINGFWHPTLAMLSYNIWRVVLRPASCSPTLVGVCMLV